MVKENDVNIAVVGCGHWGKNHVRNFSELGALAAICDADADRASQFAKQYHVSALSLEQIAQDDSIHGVVLATPAETHGKWIKTFLDVGKDVLVEKPLCLDSKEGAELVAQAKSQQRILMVGHILQYHGAFQKVREIVTSGVLGKIHYIQSNRRSHGKIRMEEDVWWSFAPHDISMILALTGEAPVSVSAHHQAIVQPDIADISHAHLLFKSGIQAEVNASWLNPFKEHRMVVTGEKGMLVFDDRLDWEQKVQQFQTPVVWENGIPAANKSEPENVALRETEPLKEECRHFIQCIASRAVPLTSGDEALAVLKVLEAGANNIAKKAA